MKNFVKIITAISTALAAIWGILSLIDKLKNHQPDVIYFDSAEGEEKE